MYGCIDISKYKSVQIVFGVVDGDGNSASGIKIITQYNYIWCGDKSRFADGGG